MLKKQKRRSQRYRRKRMNSRNAPYIGLVILMALFGLVMQVRYNNRLVETKRRAAKPLLPCAECAGTGLNPQIGFTMGHHSQSAFSQTTLILNQLSEGHSMRELVCPFCGGSGVKHRRAGTGAVISRLQDALAQQALLNLVTRPATCRTCLGTAGVIPDLPWRYNPDQVCPDCSGAGFELLHDSIRVWTEVIGEPTTLIEAETILQDQTRPPDAPPLNPEDAVPPPTP